MFHFDYLGRDNPLRHNHLKHRYPANRPHQYQKHLGLVHNLMGSI